MKIPMVRWPSLIVRFCQKPAGDQRLLVEALFFLGLSRIATATLPFRMLMAWTGRRRSGTDYKRTDTETVERIGQAITLAARRAPFRAVCLQQALAAQEMLRRRGLKTTIHFGVAANDRRGIDAHAWVTHDDLTVIGDGPGRFTPIATFTSDRQ
jgi:hypothetical protein